MKTRLAYVDYYRNGLWGAWYDKHKIGRSIPNVIHHSPEGVCKTLGELAKAQNIRTGLVLCEAINILYETGLLQSFEEI